MGVVGVRLTGAGRRLLWIALLPLAGLLATPTITHPDTAAGEQKAQLCLLCHKPNNPMAYAPTLEGQRPEYLYNQIKAYQDGRRRDLVMETNVASLSDADIRDISAYFAARPPVRAAITLDADKVARGRSRAKDLGCAACHRPDFAGYRDVPRLAGLDRRYGGIQILHFVQGRRPHPPVGGLSELSKDDAECLAEFFAALE